MPAAAGAGTGIFTCQEFAAGQVLANSKIFN